jgi:hypothetical protein
MSMEKEILLFLQTQYHIERERHLLDGQSHKLSAITFQLVTKLKKELLRGMQE